MATLYARPGEATESTFEGAPTGLAGTIGYAIYRLSDGGAQAVRTTAGITEVPAGSGNYFAKVTTPTTLGTYTIIWDTGVVTPATSGSDTLIITSSGRAPENEPEAHNLITLEQIKRAKGIEPSEHQFDARYEDSIPFVSEAIRKFTDRAFGLPSVTETREYPFDDGTKTVDIDDCTAVTAVEFKIGTFVAPVQSFAWRPMPILSPTTLVYDYLEIPHWGGAYSPQMGFTYNLDVLSKERRFAYLTPTVLVSATFGWPVIPADVQQAAILTVLSYADDLDENVSESIENYSFSRGGSRQFGAAESVAISGRARDLLNPYVRFLV